MTDKIHPYRVHVGFANAESGGEVVNHQVLHKPVLHESLRVGAENVGCSGSPVFVPEDRLALLIQLSLSKIDNPPRQEPLLEDPPSSNPSARLELLTKTAFVNSASLRAINQGFCNIDMLKLLFALDDTWKSHMTKGLLFNFAVG